MADFPALRPLFQPMTYHDTPSQPIPEMRYVDVSAKVGEKQSLRHNREWRWTSFGTIDSKAVAPKESQTYSTRP